MAEQALANRSDASNIGSVAPPSPEDMPRQFGKYTLLRRLAAGGMAELFIALQRSVAGFEKLIVIKRILPSMNQDKGFIEMLLHEARIAATLSHPNIVQIFDVGQVDGTYFIAMEHIHGEDIRSIVRGMKRKGVTEIPLEHTLSVILGTCAGLAYAHEKRTLEGRLLDIVHRDISPQNIVVTFTGDVKIVDFGIAKSGAQAAAEDTKDGQLKGKVPYMSPEQAAGQEIDWRSDIFAVGVLLFELTTGRRLFKGASEYETLKLILDKEYPLPSQVRPGYPEALERIVMKALEKDRAKRYQTAREMQQDIEDFVRHERLPVSQVSLTRWMESLFDDQLAQQKEALQDIKQLADVIAAQQGPDMYDHSSTSTGMLSTPGASATIVTTRRSSAGLWLALLGVLGVSAGGFFYMQKQAADQKDAQDRALAEANLGSAVVPVEEARGALDIKSTPAGCAIWLNGDLRAEVTPARIEHLPFGRELELKLTKEGLEAHRETLTLTEAEPSRDISAEMKAGSVTVVLKVEPPSYAAWLDGKLWKGARAKMEGVSANEEHKVLLSAPGYAPKTITFTAKQNETKVIDERLSKVDPAAVAAASAASTAKSSGKSGGVAADTSAAAASPVAAGPAKVRVGAKGGYCNVTVNGTSYGPTPIEAVVSSGTARVTCKTPAGATLAQAVTVAPGEVGRVFFKVE